VETLAIDGGVPVRTKGPIVEEDFIDVEELRLLIEVVEQKKLRRADATIEYERAIAEWFGTKHAIAVSSGTTTLHIALAAFGIGPGDEVIVSPYTFIAADSCVLEQNAIPIFADIDPTYLTLDPEDVERKITERTKAIVPVHMMGNPADMDAIMDLAERHNLWILEDTAQAHGATHNGRKLGTIGHVGSFSTISGKIMATGEGGFVITDDDDLYEKMWGYSDFARKKSLGPASKYHWGLPCTNYRITNLQAVIGGQQIRRLDTLVAQRTENSLYLTEQLSGVPGIEPLRTPPWGDRVYYYYVIRIDPEILGSDMLNFALALAAEGIYDTKYISTTRWMIPQHLQPVFVDKVGYGGTKCPFECPLYDGQVEYYQGMCPEAERACQEVLWLVPPHPMLTKEDLDDIARGVRKVATAFVEKKAAGIQVDYATEEDRAML